MHFNTFDDLYYRFSEYYIYKKGRAKYDKVTAKIIDSKHTDKLFYLSIQNRWLPNENDFVVAVSNTTYFMLAGFETTAMAEIIAMNTWNYRVNNVYDICADHQLLEKGLRALDRWKITF